jgi:hypothetical protein
MNPQSALNPEGRTFIEAKDGFYHGDTETQRTTLEQSSVPPRLRDKKSCWFENAVGLKLLFVIVGER